MKDPVVVVGIGEMGGVFARGFLRAGRPVFPVTRGTAPEAVAAAVPKPALALVAVAERDIHPVLGDLPSTWRDRVGLLQNELLPRDWKRHGLEQPTVIAVWFEKKKGQDVKVILPSPVHGPRTPLIAEALEQLEIPVRVLESEQALEFELVRKNLYILTTNIAGLEAGGTVGSLWSRHRELAEAVAEDVLSIQEVLVGHALPREALIDAMVTAFEADPDHGCLGRSAPQRLQRALQLADDAGLEVPTLRRIASRHLRAGAD
ncbi:MAG TPA: hypothetical protein ENK62_09395 [Chromatiales bacterium]|nr:hypothetical protein [Chromatiales bacterium]